MLENQSVAGSIGEPVFSSQTVARDFEPALDDPGSDSFRTDIPSDGVCVVVEVEIVPRRVVATSGDCDFNGPDDLDSSVGTDRAEEETERFGAVGVVDLVRGDVGTAGGVDVNVIVVDDEIGPHPLTDELQRSAGLEKTAADVLDIVVDSEVGGAGRGVIRDDDSPNVDRIGVKFDYAVRRVIPGLYGYFSVEWGRERKTVV
jgi:hypothetical protein